MWKAGSGPGRQNVDQAKPRMLEHRAEFLEKAVSWGLLSLKPERPACPIDHWQGALCPPAYPVPAVRAYERHTSPWSLANM